VVADGDAESRAEVTRLLEHVGFEVLQAASGTEALGLTRLAQPAAVLLDVALPEISGYQLCHLLRNEYGPSLPIVLLSMNRTEPYDKAAGLLLGANDYIAKPFAPDELLARIEVHLRQSVGRRDGRSVATTLTPSELRVLRLLAEGRHAKAIAGELSITPKTVAMHIHNAMKKLDVHTRTQAVALAHQLGLVDRDDSRGSSAARGPSDGDGRSLALARRRRARQRPTA
jgi:DNA-binding NarL/FixJ family response regulator